jgi:hypothetical protein
LNPFRGTRAERLDTLVSLAILVGILAATLAVLFLLAEIIGVLRQYKHVVFLFVAGAILAYLLAPMVRSLQVVVRKRWLAILSSYLVLFIALAILGVLLINPFISQARSLKDNLANPAVSSLRNFNAFKVQASHLETAVARQQSDLSAGSIPSDAAVTAVWRRCRVAPNLPVKSGSLPAIFNPSTFHWRGSRRSIPRRFPGAGLQWSTSFHMPRQTPKRLPAMRPRPTPTPCPHRFCC